MCKLCLKHGAAGKWYLNANNYLKTETEEGYISEYLEETWGNLERCNVMKVHGLFNMSGLSRNANKTLLGPFLRWYANKGFSKDGRYHRLNTKAAQGHTGQVIPFEETKLILQEKVEMVAKYYCPCKYFNRGIKEANCLAFSPLVEVLPKLPRYIPNNKLEILDTEQAISFVEKMGKKGYVHTIWCGPVPAIIGLCSCELPSCGSLRLRHFGIKVCLKGEYVATVDPNKCVGCRKCASSCQFGALSFSPLVNRPIVRSELCFGCGLCRDRCENQAINLIDRNIVPEARSKY